jgi:deoxyribonuclease IV
MIKIDKLRFGTAGIPISADPRTTTDGIIQNKKLGLGSFEMEFVHSVNITAEKAPVVKKTAEQSDIILTCHAPYFINLNSLEKEKIRASINRILNSARILNLCGGYSVCFHAGFYGTVERPKVYDTIKGNIKEMSGSGRKLQEKTLSLETLMRYCG